MRIASSPVYLDASALAKICIAEPERLLMTLGERVPLPAADGLHLALAALAGARTLVTFDRRMTAAAAAVGTFDPIER